MALNNPFGNMPQGLGNIPSASPAFARQQPQQMRMPQPQQFNLRGGLGSMPNPGFGSGGQVRGLSDPPPLGGGTPGGVAGPGGDDRGQTGAPPPNQGNPLPPVNTAPPPPHQPAPPFSFLGGLEQMGREDQYKLHQQKEQQRTQDLINRWRTGALEEQRKSMEQQYGPVSDEAYARWLAAGEPSNDVWNWQAGREYSEMELAAIQRQRDADQWRKDMWEWDPEDPWVQAMTSESERRAQNDARLRGVEGGLATANTQQAVANAMVGTDMARKQMALGLLSGQAQYEAQQRQLALAEQAFRRESDWRGEEIDFAKDMKDYEFWRNIWTGVGTVGGGLAAGYFSGWNPQMMGIGAGMGGMAGNLGYGAFNPAPTPNYGTGGY